MKKIFLIMILVGVVGGGMYLSSWQLDKLKHPDSSAPYNVTKLHNKHENIIEEKKVGMMIKNTPKKTNKIAITTNPIPENDAEIVQKLSETNLHKAATYLEENYALDMNGNKMAVSFSPEEEGNVGTENEYGEGVAVEFEPESTTISNTSPTIQLEENYITSIDGDFANPIMLEDNSGESEANPLLPENNYIEVQYEEDIAMSFDPELNFN